MARLNVSHTNAAVRATGTTVKTILQYTAPANTGAVVRRARITFDGVAPTGPKVLCIFTKGATGGTGTSRTPAKVSGHTGTVQGSGLENFSGEGSGGQIVHAEEAHPQGGCEIPREVLLNPGETFSVSCTVGTSVNAMASFDIEE